MPPERNDPFTVVALGQFLRVRFEVTTSLAFGCQCVSAIASLRQCVGRETNADIAVADFFDQVRIFCAVERVNVVDELSSLVAQVSRVGKSSWSLHESNLASARFRYRLGD